MSLPAITLHAPWCTLLFTRQTDIAGAYYRDLPPMQMVKRFETRGRPCPPSIIGQRVAFHQAKREPAAGTWVGEWISIASAYDDWTLRRYDPDNPRLDRRVPLPLGAVLGTGIIAASYPIVERNDMGRHEPPFITINTPTGALSVWHTEDHPHPWERIDDQLPYGDWRPGRHAWLIEDPQPLDEPVPWKGKQGWWTWEAP